MHSGRVDTGTTVGDVIDIRGDTTQHSNSVSTDAIAGNIDRYCVLAGRPGKGYHRINLRIPRIPIRDKVTLTLEGKRLAADNNGRWCSLRNAGGNRREHKCFRRIGIPSRNVEGFVVGKGISPWCWERRIAAGKKQDDAGDKWSS